MLVQLSSEEQLHVLQKFIQHIQKLLEKKRGEFSTEKGGLRAKGGAQPKKAKKDRDLKNPKENKADEEKKLVQKEGASGIYKSTFRIEKRKDIKEPKTENEELSLIEISKTLSVPKINYQASLSNESALVEDFQSIKINLPPQDEKDNACPEETNPDEGDKSDEAVFPRQSVKRTIVSRRQKERQAHPSWSCLLYTSPSPRD